MERFRYLETSRPPDPEHAANGGAQPHAPNNLTECYRSARHLREAGSFSAAAMQYERVLGFDEHRHGTWVELIDSLVRGGDIRAADKKSQEALANYGQVRAFYAARALVLAHRGKMGAAMQHSDISVEGDDTTWYARCVRAEILLMKDVNYRPEAVRLLEEALGMPGDLWEIHFLGGWAFMCAQLPTYAASYFAESAHCRPRSFISWYCLAEAFRLLRMYDQAVFYYCKAAELNPEHALLAKRMKKTKLRTYGLLQALMPVDMRLRWQRLWDEYAPPDEFTL